MHSSALAVISRTTVALVSICRQCLPRCCRENLSRAAVRGQARFACCVGSAWRRQRLAGNVNCCSSPLHPCFASTPLQLGAPALAAFWGQETPLLSRGLGTPGCHELQQWCSRSAQIITAVALNPKAVQPGGHLYCKLLKSFRPNAAQGVLVPHPACHGCMHCTQPDILICTFAAGPRTVEWTRLRCWDGGRCRRCGGGAGR